MAIMPLADYESLVGAVEDATDEMAYDRVKQRLAAAEEELLPAEFVERVLGGENKVRVWREHRGLAARDLAARASVSGAYLSQIETGARDGSIDVMKRIAAALGIGIDDIA